MKLNQLLFFRGRAYPSVTVRNEGGLVVIRPGAIRPETDSLADLLAAHVAQPAGFFATFPVAGRKWEASEPRGFWRTFSEIDRSSPEAVENFFNRYGDPEENRDRDPGETLSERKYCTTNSWFTYQKLLGIAARAWEEPDDDGVSHQTKNEQRLREARNFLGEWPVVTRLIQDRTTGALVPRAETLADYMTISAAMMVAAATPMKRCVHCDHWFGFNDLRMQFCSVSCRNSAHRAKKEAR